MNQFLVNVDRLEQGPLELEIDASPQEMELEDADHAFRERVKGALEFTLAGRDVRGVGELHAAAEASCARCLDPIHFEIDVPIDATWLWLDPAQDEHYRPSADSMMAEYYTGDSVDTKNALRELTLAALPPLHHCKPDCKGLCPGCGANLNREACRCAEKGAKPQAELPDWKKKLLDLGKPPKN